MIGTISYSLIVLAATASLATISDLKTGRIPNMLTYGSCAILVSIAIAERHGSAACWGILAACAPMLLLHVVTRGRGLGLGDVKFVASIGAALGVVGALLTIGSAFILGAIIGIIGVLSGHYQRNQRIAFAPYLSLGILCENIIQARFSGII